MAKRRRRSNSQRRERQEIGEYLAYERSTAETFAGYLSLSGQTVSERVSLVVKFLRSGEFLDAPGCVTVLMEAHRSLLRSNGEATRERIFASMAERYERLYEVLRKEGYV